MFGLPNPDQWHLFYGLGMGVLCICKLDRSFKIKPFRIIGDIVRKNRQTFLFLMCFTLSLLMIFSVLGFYTEFYSIDESTIEDFGTLRQSFFSYFLNLGGESPWCFYSAWGKFLHTICMLVSIPL